jgi:ABC-type transporter MlaC component
MAEDADAAFELLSSTSKSGVQDKDQLVEGAGEQIESWTIGEVSENGDKATASVTLKLKGETPMDITFDVVMVKEGGAWKVSLEDTGKSMDDAYQQLMEDAGGEEQ